MSPSLYPQSDFRCLEDIGQQVGGHLCQGAVYFGWRQQGMLQLEMTNPLLTMVVMVVMMMMKEMTLARSLDGDIVKSKIIYKMME